MTASWHCLDTQYLQKAPAGFLNASGTSQHFCDFGGMLIAQQALQQTGGEGG